MTELSGLLILVGIIALMFAYLAGLGMFCTWKEMDNYKKSLERRTRWREFYDTEPTDMEWRE